MTTPEDYPPAYTTETNDQENTDSPVTSQVDSTDGQADQGDDDPKPEQFGTTHYPADAEPPTGVGYTEQQLADTTPEDNPDPSV